MADGVFSGRRLELVLLQLQQAGAIWARVPLSVFLGGGLLLVVALQMLLIQGLLRLAIRAAERAA